MFLPPSGETAEPYHPHSGRSASPATPVLVSPSPSPPVTPTGRVVNGTDYSRDSSRHALERQEAHDTRDLVWGSPGNWGPWDASVAPANMGPWEEPAWGRDSEWPAEPMSEWPQSNETTTADSESSLL